VWAHFYATLAFAALAGTPKLVCPSRKKEALFPSRRSLDSLGRDLDAVVGDDQRVLGLAHEIPLVLF
jgi:hypothetical protein